jgi:hypothetical protein
MNHCLSQVDRNWCGSELITLRLSNPSVEFRKNLDRTKMEDGIDARGSRDELLLLGFGDRVKILTNIHS